ncbi:lytic polysaccharide monooxygenase [Sphaerisporangium flaviroseum]|uniref:Lytic polysaccharide monooxygenase n=1 Tax=Sphaerisporangium flaviroseum TaxID=509199 RepID=A0ABP7IBF6_9ACTN
MIRSRKVALTVAAFGLAHLPLAAPLAEARAHGALENPLSRAAACGPEGGEAATTRACRAAVAKSAANALDAWDTLRVPGVAGRDREIIPDGRLCSAGLSRFRGLDLPRGDWPATTLPAGARFAFRYRATIPHKGTFRMYVTKDGYTPTRPLTWSDLEPKPFLKVTDPKLSGGAYRMRGTLPSGRTGRHLIYTIWQNSDTPDTYYSCSDVVFAASRAEEESGPADSGTSGSGDAVEASPTLLEPVGSPRHPEGGSAIGATTLAAGGAVVILLGTGVGIALARRRPR